MTVCRGVASHFWFVNPFQIFRAGGIERTKNRIINRRKGIFFVTLHGFRKKEPYL